jgi:hypothetical protein
VRRKGNSAPGEPLVVRLQPHDDNGMVEQDDIPENCQAAVRRLIAIVCGQGKAKWASTPKNRELTDLIVRPIPAGTLSVRIVITRLAS